MPINTIKTLDIWIMKDDKKSSKICVWAKIISEYVQLFNE